RRGFKSNRKTDGDEAGAMYNAIHQARARMKEHDARTLGELFGRPRHEQKQANEDAPHRGGKPMPQARVKARVEKSKMVYDYYPDRAMILDEFEQIWEAQTPYHPDILTGEAHDSIRHVIEYQRPLKPQKAGRCTFLPEQERAPKALPSAQYARILQEVNNLKVGATGEVSRPLDREQCQTVIDFLIRPSSKTAKRTFKLIRKKLKLPESQRFSHESPKRDHLKGDLTAAGLMQKEAWGPDWFDLGRATQDDIVMKLLDTEQEQDIVDWLVGEYGMDEPRAQHISRLNLPDAHGKLSRAALDRIIPRLEAGERYDEAARQEFRDHRAMGDGEIHEKLPYYGEILNRHTAFEKDDPQNDEEQYGRVANPTVHVALNELRKVINDLIRRWGPPEQVVLELARDLPLSDRGMRELEREQVKNQEANDKRNTWLEEQKLPTNYEHRLKLRLYEEAEEAFGGIAQCVFTGKTISKTALFSADIEIEHILPVSRTLDDSFANKVLCIRDANRVKKNQTPYEAFGHSPPGYDWENIGLRAAELPGSKGWRFAPDAMEQWESRGDFLDRQLTDTRSIATLGKKFVEGLYGGQGSAGQTRQVWVIPGQLTSDIRHFAGFNTLTGLTGSNSKDRTDHRHHAVDALVIALTDQAMVKRAAGLAKREDAAAHHDIMRKMADPLKRYRRSAEDRLSKLTVSHKPDHGFQDAMHNDTAYGLTGETDEKGNALLVTRKPLDSLSKPADLDKIRDEHLRRFLMLKLISPALGSADLDKIPDERLRKEFARATMGLTGKDFTQALIQAGRHMSPPVYSVRVLDPMKPASFVRVEHGDGHSKAYMGSSNYCYDIFMGEKGKWSGEVITTFQAYQMARDNPDWWHNLGGRDGHPLIMRIRKGDMLELETDPGKPIRVVVYKFSTGKIFMHEHFEANASARIAEKELLGYQMAPSSLQRAKAVRLTVSPSGKVTRHRL
ncbi:MAG: type II CRISPR RNA-guided endonuclease Cas9, partial [Hyphomonadaceae bacterium]|nr:type II CRISPR RNA-guided endonuclease Cas9 [Hyphomonadaceae bacterium]